MGKKAKLGKSRKDKFYHLAKETGYRARSAFKLIQLNRKYQFLQQSRVLVDLCAAPGGWLQVASKFMPVSSLVIGVDLVPIKPIPNVITFQEDITTSRCKQQLQRELKTWKADCFLNDGAPNVGSAWIQDAYSQAELTLSALQLACDFLQEGGWFVTKVFRSKEYQPLMWVFQQLFKKVHATKPKASRIESAEIFVVCRGYLAPSKIDPKLLDPRHVFQEVQTTGDQEEKKVNLVKLQKPPKQAEGYPDNTNVLFKSTTVADFITGDNPLQLLGMSNRLEFDKPSEVFAKHPLTSEEIKLYCEDIKVLGPRELKLLVKWREKMRKFLDDVGSEDEQGEEEDRKEEEGEDELAHVDAKVKQLEKEEAAEVKREIRRIRKQKRKIKERLVQKAEMHKESAEMLRQEDLFRLKNIRKRSQLEEVERGEMMEIDQSDQSSGDEEESVTSEDIPSGDESGSEGDGGKASEEEADEEEISSDESGSEGDDRKESEADEGNPLLVPLENAATTRSKRANLWFSNSAFENLETEKDEEEEVQQMLRNFENKGGQLWSKENPRTTGVVEQNLISGNNCEANEEIDSDIEDSVNSISRQKNSDMEESSESPDSSGDEEQQDDMGGQKVKGDSFELVPMESSSAPVRKLDPDGMAIGALLVHSKKKRESLIDAAFNRWTHKDEHLPDWFIEDEGKHCQKQLPVSKEMVQEYRAKLKEINARPIKKVAEAKARKKRHALKKLEKARKKAESITDSVDVTDGEKMQQIKQIYKKAGVLGKRKREVHYVVAKKGLATKRAKRPAGTKGPYKMVDPRMKKDTRAKNTKRQKQRKKRKH